MWLTKEEILLRINMKTYSIAQTEDGKLEKKTEVVIVNYIEKMLGERREKIIESDEYIRQDIREI